MSECPTTLLDVSTDYIDFNLSTSNASDVLQYSNTSRWAFLNLTILSINNFTIKISATIRDNTLDEKLVSAAELKLYDDLLYKLTQNSVNIKGQEALFPSDMIGVSTPCLANGRTYTAENLSWAPDAVTLTHLDFGTRPRPISYGYNGSNAPPAINITAPRECLYAIEHYDWLEAAQGFFKETLRGTCKHREAYPAPSCGDSFWLENLASVPLRMRNEVAGYLDDVAESLTRRFRMGATAEGTGQGNATDVPGVVTDNSLIRCALALANFARGSDDSGDGSFVVGAVAHDVQAGWR
ncbi:hypothetical protein DM02DRAFT_652988 [Periconia macrospinosa]|uniref:Uncharacterized protein n=1 Tax=Periconia macrospinosa TaxID=97972 RepID=A0A2V1E1I3_9PLEO|nr:hypothetical protein DM02DRAFT_652988 [Periconia macrospinosa]